MTPPGDGPSERIGVRDLRADLAAAVRRAAAGSRVVITVDGRPVAQLGPLTATGALTLDDLIATGAVLAPRRLPGPHVTAAPVTVWPGLRLDRLLRDVRG